MALTAEEYQSLVNAGLVKFYQKNKPLYQAKAQAAYNHTKTFVAPTGQPVRVDDVIAILEPALRVDPTLSAQLSGSTRTSQKYWPRRFGDLILDDLWKELSKG